MPHVILDTDGFHFPCQVLRPDRGWYRHGKLVVPSSTKLGIADHDIEPIEDLRLTIKVEVRDVEETMNIGNGNFDASTTPGEEMAIL